MWQEYVTCDSLCIYHSHEQGKGNLAKRSKIESYKSAYFENIISNDYAMTMQVKVWIS
jgi:hypothetical protein